jgi:ATP-dependent DNA helicase RecQ
VATGALGTGIDIAGVVYIVYLSRPYGLTSFIQQAGRGGRAGELSESIILLPRRSYSDQTFPAPRHELVSTYLVEAQDKAVLTEYLESSSCRRAVLARYLNSNIKGTDCLTTDSMLYNRCQASLKPGCCD